MGPRLRSGAVLGALCMGVCLLALLAASTPAVAAPRTITGKLSKRGYTVIALATNGSAATVRARTGVFRLQPRAGSVTLHLRGPDGVYAGPIVVGTQRKGMRAVLGVKAGAKLGVVNVRRGYARVTKPPPRKWVDTSRTARARKGVPTGARVFGRVRAQPPRTPPPGDFDYDGIPDSLDIDDDGDLILDDVDRSRSSRQARAAQAVFDSPALHSFLELALTETVNVNAGSTDQQIEGVGFFGAVEIRSAALFLGLPPAGSSAELDCGRDDPATPAREGLVYCSGGDPPSKGTIFPSGIGGPAEGFPGCCDADGDGFGTLVPASHVPGLGMDLHYTATTAEMRTGQVLIKHVTTGDPRLCPPPLGQSNPACVSFSRALEYVFATVPALVGYSDTQGNAGTVSYPVPRSAPAPGPPGGRGTRGNGFPVAAGPDGNVVVTLTLWQPQRRPIGEGAMQEACLSETPPCPWVDIGGLTYSAVVHSPPQPPSGLFVSKECPQDAYSIPPGQPFNVATNPLAYPGLTDTLLDRRTNPANKLTYTVNLTKCLAGVPWNPGEEADVHLWASGQPSSPDAKPSHAAQFYVAFTRRDGRLTVRKQTDPAESPPGNGTFDFDPDSAIGGANFTLPHDGQKTYDLLPGTYTVDELATPGYELTGVTCDDPDSTGSTADRRATFRIAVNEHVTCTFTNSKVPAAG